MNHSELLSISKNFLEKEIGDFNISDTKKLSEIISLHGDLYYNQESPVISDSEYDMLFHKLSLLKQQSGEQLTLEDKTGNFSQSSFEKVAHSRPMISLDNTYNEEELRDFDTRIKRILKQDGDLPYTIEFKFDGLGIELVYQDGNLVQAITRGNGIEGEDVTENVKQIKNIPHRIDKTGRFEVRGEVVMPISSFERLNKQALENGEKVFSNPRNAASGSLRVLDTSITKKRDLQYFAYDLSDFTEFSQGAYHTMIETLSNLGFEISSYFPKCNGVEEVIYAIENIGDIKKQIDFEIDGLVVKVDDISLWKTIGSTEHHPRYAIAYKFPAEIVTTKLESVQHSVGRTGTITPVAILEAVNIGGAVIRRATLHNYDEVEKLGVKVGDYVFLKRAGEVIPKITAVATHGEGENIYPPEFCPSCGVAVMKDDEKVRYYCPNNYGCPAQMREKIAFAVGKQGFNIDGFGEKQAELFYTLGYVETFADIFRLKNYKQEILELEGFQEKSVNNLLEGIEKVRNTDIVTFLKALGIPGVGKKTAKIISDALTLTLSQREREQASDDISSSPFLPLGERIQEGGLTIEDIINSGFLSPEKLQELPDIGPEVARSVIDFFRTQQNISSDLLSELTITFNEDTSQKTGKWQGKKMCITGSFAGYKREQLAEILEKEGGEFMSSVSKKTDYLLAGEKAGSKLKKAQELGVEVLSLKEFLK